MRESGFFFFFLEGEGPNRLFVLVSCGRPVYGSCSCEESPSMHMNLGLTKDSLLHLTVRPVTFTSIFLIAEE